MTLKVGDKLHNPCISHFSGIDVVLYDIIKIEGELITIQEKDSKRQLTIPRSYIDERINRVSIPKPEKAFLECICGSQRFSFDEEKKTIICTECFCEFEKEEISTLKQSNTLKPTVEIKPEILH